MSGRRYSAALVFTVTALAGCSLVEQVIVVEHGKEAVKPGRALVRSASSASITSASGALLCSQTGAGCSGEAISKTYSADYDSGPVLKPIKKVPEKKPAEAREESAFAAAVKSWIKTGMQLPGWIAPRMSAGFVGDRRK